jgi:poly-gamma-glutamate capsule biosynthesis protein CapA/YwtB (metallophosphatase superfamily)
MIELDRKFAIFTYVALALLFTPTSSHAYNFDAVVQAWEDEYLGVPIDLEGRVIDEHGLSIVGAQLSLIGFGASLDNDGEATDSVEAGNFRFVDLARANVLMLVEAPGHYPEIVAVDLQQSKDEDEVDLGEIVLHEQRFDRARLTFGGDVMFARRYFDDLLHMNTLEADTAALFRFVEPVLQADDLTIVNLETPVTADLSTPHPVKSNVFNAYPESADALEQVGVDAVTLGNNHVFDYLAKGTSNTFAHLDQIGMPWFGAGLDDTQARQNWWATSIGEIDLIMQGFCDNRGDYGSSSLYVTAADPNKPGSLWSSLSRIDDFFDEVDGQFAIPQFHGGREYAYAQTSAMRDDFEAAIDGGAGLVIAHHPHVVHGVTRYDGGDGPRYVFGSLGNFVFDQRFWETFSSYLVSVDLEQGQAGVEVARVRLIPMHLDGYVPRLLTGVGITELGRYVAHLGTEEQIAGGFTRAVVFAEDGKLLVTMHESDVSISDLSDQRIVPLSNGSTGPVPLDPYDDNDALARLATTAPATCELGFDRLQYGDFEDRDVDDQAAEGDRWERTFARYIQRHTKRTGQAAAVLLRNASNTSRAGLETIADVPVTAGRRVSITGWSKGSNAGKFEVTVEFKRSSGSTISTTTRTPKTGGSWDWQAFTINLTVPNNTAKVELTYYQSPPKQGEGLVFLDDLELLEWDTPTLNVNASGVSILTPNGWDAVRCSAAGANLGLTLTHRVYETPAL